MADKTKTDEVNKNETMQRDEKGSADPKRQQGQEFGKDREKSAIGGQDRQQGQQAGQQGQQQQGLGKDREKSAIGGQDRQQGGQPGQRGQQEQGLDKEREKSESEKGRGGEWDKSPKEPTQR